MQVMKNNILKFGLCIVIILLISSASKAATIDIYVYNTEFSINPPGSPVVNATITQGDFIRWVWVQGGHTTTSVAGSPEQWDQPINSANTQYLRQFNNIGVFVYYCIPHGSDNGNGTASGMSGTITVLAAGSGACCLPNGSCVTTNQSGCLSQNGTFSGIGTMCSNTTCEVTAELIAVKDNILYESTNGTVSNGAGQYLYTGNNNNGRRRTVVAFDLSSIPDGAVIDNVQLSLYCNDNNGTSFPITAHRINQNWGEGASDASGQESNGATSQTGDATWIHTFYNTNTWSTPGGTYTSTPSATVNVNGTGFFSWTSAQLLADVQHWQHMPTQNFGWILRGDEASTNFTKRFSSRQNGTAANNPRLIVHYLVPPKGACCLNDGSCEFLTEMQCMTAGGSYQGDGINCNEVQCNVVLTPFLDPLPLPSVALPVSGTVGGAAHYRINITEQFQQLHSQLPPTRVWGYNGSYPGPTIEAFRDLPVTVRWVNNIRVFETGQLRTTHVLPIDECLHGPNVTGQVPVTVTHLHGGKVAPHSDGYPDDAFPPGDSSSIYTYPNIQPAGTLWYHDHALGITRLNVMMGLAGLYMIRDNNELSLNLPSGEYEVPLVIQDKSFNNDGSIRYHEMFQDHFFGNVIMVNGKVWPYLNVKKGKYRFRVINGSNSRAYTLALSNGTSFTQIGSELGLLQSPVTLTSLTMLPGERYDLIIDFSNYTTGTEIILTNSAPAPFPGFAGVGVIPNVMKFVVQGTTGYTSPIPNTLAVVEQLQPANADEERLFELMTMASPPCGEHNHPMWTINGLMWDDITEFPVLGSTEIWTWHNQSGISHPMHMHLVAFQILDRQAINDVTGQPEGPKIPPDPSEKGWKDTANCPPGFRTRVIARFDGFTGLYPYHCHILEHEDHEMMRQFEVQPCQKVTKTDGNGPGSLPYAISCALDGDSVYFAQVLVGDTINVTDTLIINKDITILNLNGGTVTINGGEANALFRIFSGSSATIENLTLISGSGEVGRSIINEGQTILDNIIIHDNRIPQMTGNTILNSGLLTLKNNSRIRSGSN